MLPSPVLIVVNMKVKEKVQVSLSWLRKAEKVHYNTFSIY